MKYMFFKKLNYPITHRNLSHFYILHKQNTQSYSPILLSDLNMIREPIDCTCDIQFWILHKFLLVVQAQYHAMCSSRLLLHTCRIIHGQKHYR